MRYISQNLSQKKNTGGPYILKENQGNVDFFKKTNRAVKRITVVNDVEITMLQRKYWKNYCYQGTGIDPNTGCLEDLITALPDLQESNEWIRQNKCNIGFDCIDCYGDKSDACLDPMNGPRRFVEHKEAKLISVNNHFGRHTCNLSWGCSMHKSVFPTFVTKINGTWKKYTMFQNNSALFVDAENYWTIDDMILKKTKNAKLDFAEITMECIINERTTSLSCHDNQFGHFIELGVGHACSGKSCYELIGTEITDTTWKIVDLKAASIEDLRQVVEREHLLNLELKYNVAKLLEELYKLQTRYDVLVTSVAKIDDKLIGNLLGNGARTKFVGKNEFFLYKNNEPEVNNTNCINDTIFKEGRWTKLLDKQDCVNFTTPTVLSMGEEVRLWIPEMKDAEEIGTVTDFDGWTYLTQEKDKLNNALRETINAQSTTSMGDLLEYPKGALKVTILSFLASHVLIVTIVVYLVFKKCKKVIKINNREEQIKLNIINVGNMERDTYNNHENQMELKKGNEEEELHNNQINVSENVGRNAIHKQNTDYDYMDELPKKREYCSVYQYSKHIKEG